VSHQNTDEFLGILHEFMKVAGLNKFRRMTALRAVELDRADRPKGPGTSAG
jgi:hypothetical protein